MLFFSSSSLIAGGFAYNPQTFQMEPNTAYSGDDYNFEHTAKDTYIYAGYVFSYRFLNSDNQTIVGPNGIRVAYPVKGNTPNDFNSIEVGIGRALTRYVDLQLAYIQEFTAKKSGSINSAPYTNTISMIGMDANVLWIFNPDDQIQVGAKLGVRIADFREKIDLNGASYYPVDDSTEINPRFGLDFNFQINPTISFRLGTTYTLSAYRIFYEGGIDVFAGLSAKI